MGKLSVIRFFKDQWRDLELVPADLTGKTVIVTGANVGLGLETAKHFARMKPGKLILACRDATGANEAIKREKIRQETKIGKEIIAWDLDLGSFASVVAFVNKFEAEGGGRLDLLVENAAIATREFQKTQDGWERSIQVNHLSTALLSLLLLPSQITTTASGPTPRLVILSSDAHYLVGPAEDSSDPKILEKLSDESYATPARMAKRYNISKLLTVFLARSLTAHLSFSTPLTVVSVNPGLCHSSLTRHAKGFHKPAITLSKYLFARTSEMGSRTIVWSALGGENQAVHGRYLDSCRVGEESDWALSKDGQEMQDNVWKETIEILKKVDPRVESIVTKYLSPQ